MTVSVIVTGAARGVGRAIAERLLADGCAVVVLDVEPADWIDTHERAAGIVGSAADSSMTERAADAAEALAPLRGWVNNAAVFRDAFLHERPTDALDAITLNVSLAVTGAATATRRFLASGAAGAPEAAGAPGAAGAIVNVSSHQARRAVAGALPYATAKAAIEGLTRALAVDYGPRGIRSNAVALGSIETERFDDTLRSALDAEHPLGRIGRASEVADVVAWLLSDASSFVNGAVIPVDGGRAARGHDPEERWPA